MKFNAKHSAAKHDLKPHLEKLEERLVLSLPTGTAAGTFSPGGIEHVIGIDSLSEDLNNDCVLNASEVSGAAGAFDFFGFVDSDAGAFHGQATVELLDGGTLIASTTGFTSIPGGTAELFTLSVPTGSLGEGVHNLSLRVRRTNPMPPPAEFVIATNDSGGDLAAFTITVDTMSLATVPPDLVASSDSSGGHANSTNNDNYTGSANPLVINIPGGVGGAEAGATVTLQRDSGAGFVNVGTRTGPGTFNQSLADGSYRFRWSQVDSGGNASGNSPILSVTVDRTQPSAQTATPLVAITTLDQVDPNNPAVTSSSTPNFEIRFVEQQSILNNDIGVQLSVDGNVVSTTTQVAGLLGPGALADSSVGLFLQSPVSLAVGMHSATVTVTDDSGNVTNSTLDFEVAAPTGAGAAGTPVFSEIFSLDEVQDVLGAPFNDSSEPLNPWTMTFDPTTQTVWLTLENTRFDPVNNAREFGPPGLINFDPATGLVRVYDLAILGPNADNPHGVFFDFETHITPRVWFVHRNAITKRGGNQLGPAQLSYLDVASSQLITYDFEQDPALAGLDLDDLHFIKTDARGVIWASAAHSQAILEIDVTRRLPGPTLNDSINSASGIIRVHRAPTTLPNFIDDFEPHGVDVLVDDVTGEQYVWLADENSGAFVLLRPGSGTGANDQWFFWDVREALNDEGRTLAHVLFLAIDDNETPGFVFDDKILYSDPGRIASPAGVLRELDPGAFLADPTGTTSSTIRTFRVPDPTGNNDFSFLNQAFVDRGGTVFFADRTSGVGRLDTDLAVGDAISAPITTATGAFLELSLTPTMNPVPTASPVLQQTTINPEDNTNEMASASLTLEPDDKSGSSSDAVDQYFVQGLAANQGAGPFRVTLNAGNTLYGSITQSDRLSTTIFAETERRQTAVVAGLDGARLAFQVLRNGDIIATFRGRGELVDRQANLTQVLGGDPVEGDVSAVADADGIIHVFGRVQGSTSIVDYRFNGQSGTWLPNQLMLTLPGNLIPAGEPTAFVDSQLGAGAMVTTASGDLVALFANGTRFNLGGEVYGSVGVVERNGIVLAYGPDMTGSVVQYAYPSGNPAAVVSKTIDVSSGTTGRATFVFQDVSPVIIGGAVHLLGTDGNARLVELRVTDAAPLNMAAAATAFGLNVTESTKSSAAGYQAYQQPFAARVYSEIAPVLGSDGTLYVYGVNGRDLVEFTRNAGGNWSAANLTNDITKGTAARPIEANKVFGAPDAYVLPNGDRHVLMINKDGELIEYYFWQGDGQFHTQNVTLARGNTVATSTFGTDLGTVTGFAPTGVGGATSTTIAALGAELPPNSEASIDQVVFNPVSLDTTASDGETAVSEASVDSSAMNPFDQIFFAGEAGSTTSQGGPNESSRRHAYAPDPGDSDDVRDLLDQAFGELNELLDDAA